ncbi:MAG: thioredoxin family protein, partial [Candidatus Zixiibacteriota bacterium]
GINWAVYSEEKVREHLAEGEVVFVDVTAEWCVTCKFNEKLFIETDQIIDRINQNGIVALKADWTNRNREIGDFLARYGRSGIPFYIVYYGGDEKNYIALPITITGSKLAKTLDEAIEKNRIFTRAQQEKPAALMTTP